MADFWEQRDFVKFASEQLDIRRQEQADKKLIESKLKAAQDVQHKENFSENFLKQKTNEISSLVQKIAKKDEQALQFQSIISQYKELRQEERGNNCRSLRKNQRFQGETLCFREEDRGSRTGCGKL